MKKVIATIMAAGLVAQVASAVDAGVDFASAYVFRGVTVNDGTVAQPYVEGEVLGVTVGTWANIDIANQGAEAVSEIDLYLGYGLGEVAGYAIDLGYCEYTYPGTAGNGESEVSLAVSGDVLGYDASVAAFADVAADGEIGYYEGSLGGGYDLTADIAASYGVSIGYFDGDDAGFGYAALTFGVEKPITDALTAGISLTLIEDLDDDIMTALRADSVAAGIGQEDQVIVVSVGGSF